MNIFSDCVSIEELCEKFESMTGIDCEDNNYGYKLIIDYREMRRQLEPQ